MPLDFLLSSAVVRSPCCIFFWRDAAQRCGRHDKNDPLFGGFSSLQSSKIGISPGRKKVSHGKPTEKWVIFIKTGKLCCSSAIQGTPIGKGPSHDSARTMLLCARGPLNLSKALLFGSTLAGGCPFASFPSLERGTGVCSDSSIRRTPLRVCVLEILCVSRFAARRGSDVPFWVSRRHVVVFSARMRKIFPFGVPRGALADHIAPSKLFPIRKSPGRALQASDERESMTLQPTPNGNILHICACFLTRWLSLVRLHLGNPSGPSRRLGNEKSSHRGRVSRIERWFVGKRWGYSTTFLSGLLRFYTGSRPLTTGLLRRPGA